MELKLINDDVVSIIETNVERVISGEQNSFKIDCCCPSIIADYLRDKYCLNNDEFDCNGWDWDYWIAYYLKGKRFVLSGCGYYGSTYFRQEDEEE